MFCAQLHYLFVAFWKIHWLRWLCTDYTFFTFKTTKGKDSPFSGKTIKENQATHVLPLLITRHTQNKAFCLLSQPLEIGRVSSNSHLNKTNTIGRGSVLHCSTLKSHSHYYWRTSPTSAVWVNACNSRGQQALRIAVIHHDSWVMSRVTENSK